MDGCFTATLDLNPFFTGCETEFNETEVRRIRRMDTSPELGSEPYARPNVGQLSDGKPRHRKNTPVSSACAATSARSTCNTLTYSDLKDNGAVYPLKKTDRCGHAEFKVACRWSNAKCRPTCKQFWEADDPRKLKPASLPICNCPTKANYLNVDKTKQCKNAAAFAVLSDRCKAHCCEQNA